MLKEKDYDKYDCEQCRSDAKAIAAYMILCPNCGNKRCPQAQDHRMKCTRSNNVGQIGELK